MKANNPSKTYSINAIHRTEWNGHMVDSSPISAGVEICNRRVGILWVDTRFARKTLASVTNFRIY